MAQEGYDKLMALTDSRYRLSMITARRAAQLKAGFPALLDSEEMPRSHNTVSIAMRELEFGKALQWGDDLPPAEDLRRGVEQARRQEQESFGVPGSGG